MKAVPSSIALERLLGRINGIALAAAAGIVTLVVVVIRRPTANSESP